MFCNKCGSKVEGNAKFCNNCGNILSINGVNQNINTSEERNGLAVASLVIGIISIMLSFILNIFIFPLGITGLILGIVNKNKCGSKTAGIVLNSVSMVIAIIILITAILIVGSLNELWEEEFNVNDVSGIWNCKSFDGSGESDEYIVTMKLNNDNSFVWNKYGDEINNHVYGTYMYEDEEKTNPSGDYKYYMINLIGEEFVNEGVLQDQEYKSQYEIGINEDYGAAILMNVATYNMYYCYLEK